MRIQVRGIEGIADLADDLKLIPSTMRLRANAVLARNAELGNHLAQEAAEKAAGPHGRDYYKRLTAEAKGPLAWEFGPEGPPKSDYVGVSGTAGAMRDLEKAADRVAPRLAREVGKMLDDLFWPGA